MCLLTQSLILNLQSILMLRIMKDNLCVNCCKAGKTKKYQKTLKEKNKTRANKYFNGFICKKCLNECWLNNLLVVKAQVRHKTRNSGTHKMHIHVKQRITFVVHYLDNFM